MKITHYLYNAFLVEDGDIKIAIDPGALFLYYFRLTSLIPKSEWPDITHIFVTHGDTLFLGNFWEDVPSPDVLMIPIGGKAVHNTMDETEAARATEIFRPKTVIPCHYNCPGLFSRRYNPGDDQLFRTEVEKQGTRCVILGDGESVNL